MQIKALNVYRITHKNGNIEDITAETLIDALQHMEVEENYSPVIQVFLIKEAVRTVIEDALTEAIFTAVVADNGGGSIATPASGRIHVGDTISLRAIPERGYEFVSWTCNGVEISTEEELNYTMPELASGYDTYVFTAKFALKDVPWTASVSPDTATSAGCYVFPESGTEEANDTLQLIAVPGTGYTFDHWERNGETVANTALASVTLTPLAEGETAADYVAVFTAN